MPPASEGDSHESVEVFRVGERRRVIPADPLLLAPFIDDRVDMFPRRVSRDYLDLLRARPDALTILARYDVDVVLWDKALPLVTTLKATGKWQEAYAKGDWVVMHRA